MLQLLQLQDPLQTLERFTVTIDDRFLTVHELDEQGKPGDLVTELAFASRAHLVLFLVLSIFALCPGLSGLRWRIRATILNHSNLENDGQELVTTESDRWRP